MKRARIDDSEPASGGSASHPPKISRRIRACEQCQVRKSKCDIQPNKNQCTRCARLGLDCVVKKSLQTLLDSENEWKTEMEARFEALQSEVLEIRQLLNMSRSQSGNLRTSTAGETSRMSRSTVWSETETQDNLDAASSPIAVNDATAMTRANSSDPTHHGISQTQPVLDTPMASLYEVTKLRNIRSDPQTVSSPSIDNVQGLDPIARGKLSLQEGERLFSTFKETLDAYLWSRVALVHETLEEARASSTLLTTAILTVTALHEQDQGRTFDICYPIFLQLASQSVFARYHTLDDIRGLCIGAFWLSDLSWKLSGLAVRIATELNLHQFSAEGFRNASEEQLEKSRLWYLLYVCDHHFSIAYGRPPVISESAVITRHENVLKAPDVRQSDLRLHSQVGVFIILSRMFHTFGSDQSRLVTNDEFEALRRYDIDLDLWRDHWERRLAPDKHISQYPSRGVVLHYHFARLQLLSVCLRGLTFTGPYAISAERREFVNMAIASATSTLTLILDDPDMRRAVIGVPLYLLTAITYACLFLMKVQSQWKRAEFDIDYGKVVQLVEGTIAMLNNARQCVRHVTHYIGTGLNSILRKLQERETQDERQSFGEVSANTQWEEIPGWGSWGVEAGIDYLGMLDTLYLQMPQ